MENNNSNENFNNNMNDGNINNNGGRRQNMNGNNYNQMPPKKPFYKKIWFIILVVIVVIIIIASASSGDESDNSSKDVTTSENTTNNDDGSKEEAEPTVEISVSATDLIAAYENNELSAEDTYKGKYVELTGYFYSADDTSLKISGTDEFSFTNVSIPLEVGTENYEYAKGLSEGDPITVRGTIKGYDGLLNIEFESDAVIVQ